MVLSIRSKGIICVHWCPFVVGKKSKLSALYRARFPAVLCERTNKSYENKILRNIFIGVGVLFALARVMFAGTGETGLVTSRRILRTTPVNGHK